MFIFTEPYISSLAKDFILNVEGHRIVDNHFLNAQALENTKPFLSQADATTKLIDNEGRWLYCNSENALTWLDKSLPDSHRLHECIELFKNKHLFRQRYKDIFPDVEFQLLSTNDVLAFKFDDFGKPFIIKPTVGFLSAGVYRINSQKELEAVQENLICELEAATKVFPKSVLDSSSFILEGVIEGREFAIDAFYTDDNEPVITNIFEHIFRDKEDMSDKLYTTSAKLIREFLEPFTEFLNQIQQDIDLAGFVLHAEIRVDEAGTIRPIEVNPLRFAGWCTTDLSYWAHGINPYTHFADRQRPDWDTILSKADDKVYGMSVVSSPNISEVETFDYDKFEQKFNDLKELRRIDFKKYPLFCFAFFTMEENDTKFSNWLLNTDFSEFCSLK